MPPDHAICSQRPAVDLIGARRSRGAVEQRWGRHNQSTRRYSVIVVDRQIAFATVDLSSGSTGTVTSRMRRWGSHCAAEQFAVFSCGGDVTLNILSS